MTRRRPPSPNVYRPGIGDIRQGFVVPSDQLDRFERAGYQQLDMAIGERPAREIMPTDRPLAGALMNNRGHAIILVLDPDVPVYQQPISVVETPRDAGDDAENIIVTLGMTIEGPEEDTLLTDATAVAEVEWGVGGVSFHADIDWIQGCTFSLPASFVRIAAKLDASNTGEHPVSIALAASLAYGCTRGPGTPCRRTIVVGDLVALATSAPYAIPLFATSVTLVSHSSAAFALNVPPNLQIRLTNANTVDPVVAVYQWVSRTNQANQWELTFPIPNGARTFDITNFDAVNAALGVRAIFNLGLP